MSIIPSPNAWKEISLSALRHNLDALCARLGPDARLLAVVKSNAYGHDMETVALEAQKSGIADFGVSNVREAVRLRETLGPDAEIIMLEPAFPGQEEEIVKNRICPVLCCPDFVKTMNRAAEKLNATAPLHIALDTGMGRIGARTQDELDALIRAIQDSDRIDACGVFTHFSSADDPRCPYTNEQAGKFKSMAAFVQQRLGRRITLHAANSATLVSRPDLVFDLARAGIAMYGINPFARPEDNGCPLEPVMSVRTRVSLVKEVEEGAYISYSRTHRTARRTKIATLSIGYGHGLSRALSNRMEAIIGGRRYKQVGNVTMSQIMLDLGPAEKSVRPGDIATIIGSGGEERISAEDVAARQNTIGYEVVCGYSALELKIAP